ncbi:MAG: ATP-binding cassette domain-containing protein [Desulfarculus sp.]|nr:ATP-binding cassette domain-containing protein [Desulfarculus sp.]
MPAEPLPPLALAGAAPPPSPAAAGHPVISVRGLTAGYGGQVILDNVSFNVARGEILVIVGGSGCGKSTLLKHMIGLHPLMAGRVVINGVDIGTALDADMARLHQGIGVLFQSGALFGSMTLIDNVALPLLDFTHLPKAQALKLARVKLGMVGLAGYENHLPSEISGGMKKRAGLARAMALDPSVLFFDEPSAGLDPVTSAELDQLILRINAGLGTSMVIVSHELASIFSIAHRVVMLDKAEKGVIAMGDPRELLERSEDPRVRGFFLRQPPA